MRYPLGTRMADRIGVKIALLPDQSHKEVQRQIMRRCGVRERQALLIGFGGLRLDCERRRKRRRRRRRLSLERTGIHGSVFGLAQNRRSNRRWLDRRIGLGSERLGIGGRGNQTRTQQHGGQCAPWERALPARWPGGALRPQKAERHQAEGTDIELHRPPSQRFGTRNQPGYQSLLRSLGSQPIP